MSVYKLSASLVGHEDDVKAITIISSDTIASVSRDSTLRSWNKTTTDGTTSWYQSILYKDSKYINAVTSDRNNSSIIFGGLSNRINIVGVTATPRPPCILGSHEANVCALDSSHGLIVSGSWDCNASVWVANLTITDTITDVVPELLYTLKGHQASVWAVLILSESLILTGSADRSIKLWKNGKLIKSIDDAHDDAVRGLCRISDTTFASCSNDTTIKLWSIDSLTKPLQILKGHTSFVYSVAASGNTLVSGGEDRSVRVWDIISGECIQVITLPCTSVWSVGIISDEDNSKNRGDIVAGGSDNMIRIFSTSPDRWASADEILHLEETVASTGLGKDQTGGVIDESQISPSSVLKGPGKKEGQVVMVRSGGDVPGISGSVEAYQWTTGIWVKIGEVVQSAGTSGKKVLYEGSEYDYVFDVDIREGVPPLKLPYNLTQNPYEVAQKFVEKYELSAGYVDEVAKFLISNTESVDISSQPVDDPYGSRYLPGGGSTGGSSSSASQKKKKSDEKNFFPAGLNIIPLTTPVSLVSFQPDPIIKALSQNNDKQQSNARLSADDIATIETVLKTGITNSSAENLFRYFVKVEQSWNSQDILPALDILRLIIPSLEKPSAAIVQTIFSNLDPSSPKNALLATRSLVNLFSTAAGSKLASNPQIRDNAFDPLAEIVKAGKSTKPLDLAIASLLLNYSVTADQNSGFLVLSNIITLFKERPDVNASSLDSETVYRLLLALGTILANPLSSSPALREAALTVDLGKWAQNLAKDSDEPRMKELIVELKKVLV